MRKKFYHGQKVRVIPKNKVGIVTDINIDSSGYYISFNFIDRDNNYYWLDEIEEIDQDCKSICKLDKCKYPKPCPDLLKEKELSEKRLTRCMGDCPNINVICKGCSFPDYVEEYEEKEMEKQKFIFESEEQAEEMLRDIVDVSYGYSNKDTAIETYIRILKQKDYIRKSELRILIEAAEQTSNDHVLYSSKYLAENLMYVIKALIKEVERLGGKI